MSIIADCIHELVRLSEKSDAPITDKQIGHYLAEWRQQRNAAATLRHPKMTKEQYDSRVEIYRNCKSDSEASKIIGIHPSAFAEWRRRNGLAPKMGRL